MTSLSGPPAGHVISEDATWSGGSLGDVAAFGVRWQGTLPVGAGWAPGSGAPDQQPVVIRAGEVDTTLPGATLLWEGYNEGGTFKAWRAADGELLMTHDHGGRFFYDPRESSLDVAAGVSPLITARTLLDSVMFTVALARGHVLIHGSAVSDGHRAIVIVGASGRGKTSLALALRGRGLQHLTDDVLMLQADGADVLAHPGPPVVTVPEGAALRSGSRALATVDGERWDAVAVTPKGMPVVAIVELIRPDQTSSEVVPLLSHMLSVPPERARDRFVMLSLLSERCALIRIPAQSSSPDELAQQVLDRLGWSLDVA